VLFRSKRLKKYFAKRPVPSNAWIGVSVEDKRYGLPRIKDLQTIDASIRFLSIEPLLEDLGSFNLDSIDWVIVGGESGNKAREMRPEWAENIQRQCDKASVAFFFKQWGTWGEDGVKRSKRVNGRLLEGRIWDEMPIKMVGFA